MMIMRFIMAGCNEGFVMTQGGANSHAADASIAGRLAD